MIFLYLFSFVIFGFFASLGNFIFNFLCEKIHEKIYLKNRDKWEREFKIKEKGDFINE